MYVRLSFHKIKISAVCAAAIFVIVILCNRKIRHGTEGNFLYENVNNFKTSIGLEDIMICLRTSSKNSDRLTTIFNTWLPSAWTSVFIITDHYDNRNILNEYESQWIVSNCKPANRRKDLCCKMEAELHLFLNSRKRWLCHVDDDSYMNINALVKLLSLYDYRKDLYLGKPSVPKTQIKNASFQFATGGAGFCLSKSLALKMSPYILNNKFLKLCDKLYLPDDCSIGYIINHILNVNLTAIQRFHSHLEDLSAINSEMLKDQISFSYSYRGNVPNIVTVNGFSQDADPNRFYSIHCQLHPDSKECHHLKDIMQWVT